MAEGPVVKNKNASTSVKLNSIRQNLKIINWLKVLIRNHLEKFFLFFWPFVISNTSIVYTSRSPILMLCYT